MNKILGQGKSAWNLKHLYVWFLLTFWTTASALPTYGYFFTVTYLWFTF